jgi:hypothetical protein
MTFIILTCIQSASINTYAAGDEPPPLPVLSKIEQLKLLHSRVVSGVMEGCFGEFSETLYDLGRPFMGSSTERIVKTELMTVFPESYKPTYAEFFETIARQTQSTMKYDPSAYCGWVFEPPAMPLPYTIKTANSWKNEDHGVYVSYIPKIQKMGMDIYMMGHYSGLDDQKLKEVREAIAMRFATTVDPSANLDMMKQVTVDGVAALYFESQSPKKHDARWRQWALVKNRQAFIIVSSLDLKNEDKLLPDVQAMIASFHVTQPGT